VTSDKCRQVVYASMSMSNKNSKTLLSSYHCCNAAGTCPAAVRVGLNPKVVLPHLQPSLPKCLLCCRRQTPRQRGGVRCQGDWQTRHLQNTSHAEAQSDAEACNCTMGNCACRSQRR
jgi:hypothetical protein